MGHGQASIMLNSGGQRGKLVGAYPAFRGRKPLVTGDG